MAYDYQKYQREYKKKHYKTSSLVVPIELYEKAKEEIKKNGETFNGFLNRKLKELIKEVK